MASVCRCILRRGHSRVYVYSIFWGKFIFFSTGVRFTHIQILFLSLVVANKQECDPLDSLDIFQLK